MITNRKILSSFRSSHLHSGGNKDGKNENRENVINTLGSGVNPKENTKDENKPQEKTVNFIFLMPPAIFILAVLIMYILYKIFY